VGGYRRDIAHKVLMERYGVDARCAHGDADFELWEYVRTLPDGSKATSVYTFDVGLAAYPPDTLLRICTDLKLAGEWDTVRQEIVALGGWVGR
jgi:hypothetical protein